MKYKILLGILYGAISLFVAGCAVEKGDASVVHNQNVMQEEVPEEIMTRFCEVVSPEEKDFYDEFLFISYDDKDLIIELVAKIGDKEIPIYYKYDEELKDFKVFNGKQVIL